MGARACSVPPTCTDAIEHAALERSGDPGARGGICTRHEHTSVHGEPRSIDLRADDHELADVRDRTRGRRPAGVGL